MLFTRANTHFNICTIPVIQYQSIHTSINSACPSMHTGPSGLNPSFPLVGAQVLCPPPFFAIDIHRFSCTHVLLQLGTSTLSNYQSANHLIHPPLWHPGISPWGCYVHHWNGHAGLCLPMAHCCMPHTSNAAFLLISVH